MRMLSGVLTLLRFEFVSSAVGSLEFVRVGGGMRRRVGSS